MVVADGAPDVRQFRLSREVVRGAVALGLFLVAGFASTATALIVGVGGDRADARMVAKNELLERELEYLEVRLDTLETSLADLAGRDEHYRLLAGLEPLDAAVRMAGVGGPDDERLDASALYRVDARTGERALAASLQVDALIRRASVLAFSWKEAENTLSGKYDLLGATPSIMPTRGYLSSAFSSSRWHPILGRPRPHYGIDIAARTGSPVVAPANGRVVSAGNKGAYGLLIEIDHGHGVVTRYAHLSRMAVRPGQSVTRGEQIGAVGSTGLSVGPHLHYEVLVNGRHADPIRYIFDTDPLP
jgi:murein DD-endopeptidase MepM/ murein hydrolase activator NlpD